jgi:predicted GIY-YIG superfamily endonuclease
MVESPKKALLRRWFRVRVPADPRSNMAWVYILHGARRYYIGATENLERRTAEHKRGSNHTTHRFGGQIELVAAKELPSMAEHANSSGV